MNPETEQFRSALLQRFRRIRAVVADAYYDAENARTAYDAILMLTQPSWLHEHFDDLNYKLNRTKGTTK